MRTEARIQRKLDRIRDHRAKQTAGKATAAVKTGKTMSHIQVNRPNEYETPYHHVTRS